jgi:hypothetical protein
MGHPEQCGERHLGAVFGRVIRAQAGQHRALALAAHLGLATVMGAAETAANVRHQAAVAAIALGRGDIERSFAGRL